MTRPVRHYAVTLTDDPTRGLHAVSLVERPAIERQWVTLAAEQPEAQPVRLAQEAQKQRLTGPVLIPEQVIMRRDAEGEPFTITFDAATIEAANLRMKANGLTTQTTHQHAVKLEGNVIEETWIIEDPANDKAAALGFADLPAGTLMMSVRVTDPAYWQTEVLTGNVRGFSIEGLFDFAAALAAIPPPMTEPEKPNALLALLAKVALKLGLTPEDVATDAAPAPEPAKEPEPAAVTLQSVKLADATVVELSAPPVAVLVSLEAVVMANGSTFNYNPITRRLTDGTGKMVESGAYKCADGSYFQVDTSQYTYTIDATTYERATQLSAVETQLAAVTTERDEAEAEVVRLKEETPAAKPLKMAAQTGDKPEGKSPAQLRLHAARLAAEEKAAA